MRKLIVAAVAAVLVMALVGGPATATLARKPQVVKGSILSPARHPEGSCYPGLHRRINVFGQGKIQGVVGYHFAVSKKTVGKRFVLKPTGGQGAVDLDITFYTEFGTLEQATDTAYAPPTMGFETRKPGGEKGVVPRRMKRAIVCAYDGAGVSFTYTAQTSR